MTRTRANSSPAPGAPDRDVERVLGVGGSHRARRWLVRALILLAIVAVAVLAVRGIRRLMAPEPVSWATAAVSRGDVEVAVTATGTLEPRNVVDVGSEISGRLATLHVDANDRVEAGQILAELDTDTYEAQVAQARAQLALAEAQHEQAKAGRTESEQSLRRARALQPSGALSGRELEAAEAAAQRAVAQVSLARAEIRRARAALQLAETNLRRAVIRSPIDGIVLSRDVEEGQTVVASLQAPVLFRIAEDLSEMTVSVDVDEADVGLVHEGQQATFTVAAHYGRTFDARVRKVHNAASVIDRVVTYETELDVDNREGLLRPGMTVTAQIVSETHEDALRVPNEALRFAPKGAPEPPPEAAAPGHGRVFVLQGGEPRAVTVATGPSNQSHTIVTDDSLSEGSEVIVNVQSRD